MAALRLALSVILLVLVLPLAAAAPASGALDVGGPMRFAGNLAADAGTAALFWNGTAPPDLQLQGSALHIERSGTSETVGKTPLGPGVSLSSRDVDETADVAAGRLTLSPGAGAQVVGLGVQGMARLEATDATLRGVSAAPLITLDAQLQHQAAHCSATRCLAGLGSYEVAGARDAGIVSGTVTLFLRGPVLQVTDDQGATTTYASGHTEQSNGATTQVDDTWVVVTIQKATGGFSRASTQAAYLDAPHVTGAAVSMPVATGNLRVGGRSYNAQGEAIEAAGALRLTLASLTRPTSLPDDDRVVYADGFHADVAGDVATINLHEAPVLSQAPAEAAGLAALGVAAAAAVAYYWPLLAFHAAALAAPLYTRLRQPEILDNGVRNRIYDIICANPGISARAVHRESAQSWGTVVYHLRQLERHHLAHAGPDAQLLREPRQVPRHGGPARLPPGAARAGPGARRAGAPRRHAGGARGGLRLPAAHHLVLRPQAAQGGARGRGAGGALRALPARRGPRALRGDRGIGPRRGRAPRARGQRLSRPDKTMK
jgi:hypothetical protein